MNDREKEPIDPVIIDWFTNTLLPFFSWLLSQLSLALFDCKLTVIFRHPTLAYKRAVTDSWVEGNFVFSCAEILSFTTASGRRRARKKLKKILAPFFRELRRRPEWIRLRRAVLGKLQAQMPDGSPSIPRKVRTVSDLGEIDKRRTETYSSYSSEDILNMFPTEETVPGVPTNRLVSEVGDYAETIRSLWWEAYHASSLIRQKTIREHDKIWRLLRINPDNELDMENLIDTSLDLLLDQADANKVADLARWVMGKIIISQFSLHPYSKKNFVSLEKPIGEGLTLEDTVADYRAQDVFEEIENRELLESALDELSPAQREAAELHLQVGDTSELRHRLGDKKSSSVERNFERALKRLEELRKSGKLLT